MNGRAGRRTWVRLSFVCALLALLALPSRAGTCSGLDGGPGDIDGDGRVAGGGDDCDDSDPTVWARAGEVNHLRVPGSNKHMFRWDAVADTGGAPAAVTYDMVRSRVASNFLDHPTVTCLDPGGTELQFIDPAVPPSGGVFYYIVRARNTCGPGDPGTRTGGPTRPIRDCQAGEVCDDGNACTQDRGVNGACVHTPIPPVILDPPMSTAVCPGGTARFKVQIANTTSGHFAWTLNGAPVGSDAPALDLPSMDVTNDGAQILVTVSDGCGGNVTSPPASLTVFSDAASCAGGLDGDPAPNGAGDPTTHKTWLPANFKGPKGVPDARVLLHSGELEYAESDLEIRGRGFDFAWVRYYRSGVKESVSLGLGWTHMYDRRAVAAPDGTIVVFNPMTGRDVFSASTSGCYEAPGRFESLCPSTTGGLELTFPDHGVWTFAPFDGSPMEGKILQSRDAFGNAMSFAYDTAGRLTTITDTLGRPITIAYNARSLIASVTDFTGRSVSYAYYDGVAAGGGLDDLKSVTSPPVTGTPTGNDFPQGRTTTYTYSSGSAVAGLNHQLLSVTDASGHASPRFAYCDRSSDGQRERLCAIETNDGVTASLETYAYVALTPDPSNGFAVSKTIVKDGTGQVGEYFYDAAAQLVTIDEYDGVVPNPSRFTGNVDNRPGPPPNPADPPFARTRRTYQNGLITEVSFPKLDSVSRTYDSANPNVLKRGDLVHETWHPGPEGGDQTQIDRSWSNASAFGTDRSGHREVRIVHPPGTPPGTWRRISDVRIVHPPGTPPGTWRAIRDIRIVHPPGTPPGTWRVGNTWDLDPPSSDAPGAASRAGGKYLVVGSTHRYTPASSGGRRAFNWGGIYDEVPAFEASSRRVFNWTGIFDEVADFESSHRKLFNISSNQRSAGPGDYFDNDDDDDPIPTIDGSGRSLPAPASRTRVRTWVSVVERIVSDGELPFSGYPTSVTDESGQTWTFTYDTSGFLTDISAPPVTTGTLSGAPQTIHHHWDRNAYGQIAAYTAPDGRIDTTSYDGSGYPSQVTVDAAGTALTTSYGFDALGRPISVTNAAGNTVTVYMDDDDDVVRVTGPGPIPPQFDYYYDAAGRLVRKDAFNVDENGVVRSNHHISSLYDYDAAGRLRRVSLEADNVQCAIEELEYDANGLVSTIADGLDHAGGTAMVVREVRYRFRKRPELLRVKDGAGATVAQTMLAYDADGRIVSIDDGLDGSTHHSVTTVTRDGFGRVASVTDAMGNVRSFHYDASSRVVSSRLDGEIVDGTGGPNVPLAEESYGYDEVGRKYFIHAVHAGRTTGVPIGGGVSGTTNFHDESSRLVRTEDPLGHATDFAYDGAGRLHLVTDAMGNTTQALYDGASRVAHVVETDAPSAGGPPASHATHYEYDALGHVKAVIDSAGARAETDYDGLGLAVSVRDRLGNPTRLAYDGLGRLVRTERDLTDTGTGAGSVTATAVSTDAWDDLSNRVSSTDSEGNTTSWQYDALGRVTQATAADGATSVVAWDDANSQVTVTQPNGAVQTTTFDALGRNILVSSTLNAQVSDFGFSRDGTGAIVHATTPESSVTRTYDTLGNVLTETQQFGAGPARTVTYDRDAASHVTNVAYPSGHTVSYGYDALGRMQVVFADGGFVASYGYAGAGRLSFIFRPGGVATQYVYDTAGRLSGKVEIGSAPFSQYAFAWSPDGDPVSRTEAVSASSQTRTYDSFHRLVHSSTTWGGPPETDVAYQLSLGGDRLSVTGGQDAGAYTRDATLPEPGDFQRHQYTGTPSGTRTYDASGNTLTLRGGTLSALTMTYDAYGRVRTGAGGGAGGTVSYAYDAFGRLIDSAINLQDDGLTYYGRRPIERYDTGVLDSWFVYGAGGRPLEMRSTGDLDGDGMPDVFAFHTDEAGSVTAMTNPAGDVVESYRYDDYGNPWFFDGTGLPLPGGTAIGNPLLYRGLIWSPRSNVYLYGGAQYDPHVGRWLGPLHNEECDDRNDVTDVSGKLLKPKETDAWTEWDDDKLGDRFLDGTRSHDDEFMQVETGWACDADVSIVPPPDPDWPASRRWRPGRPAINTARGFGFQFHPPTADTLMGLSMERAGSYVEADPGDRAPAGLSATRGIAVDIRLP